MAKGHLTIPPIFDSSLNCYHKVGSIGIDLGRDVRYLTLPTFSKVETSLPTFRPVITAQMETIFKINSFGHSCTPLLQPERVKGVYNLSQRTL